MADGFKIADAYAEIHADEDPLRADIAGLGAKLGAQADAAGQQLGDRLTRGLAAKVQTLSGQVAKAQVQEKKATDDVTRAETRLNVAREDGNVKGSALLALEQRLSQARDKLTLATANSTTVTRKYEQAQADLSDAIRTAAQRAEADAERGGEDVGDKLSRGMQMSLVRNSPLIVSAIVGGLMLGAPAVTAGVAVLFGGVTTAIAAQQDRVRSAFAGLRDDISSGLASDAQAIVPIYEGIANKIDATFLQLQPQIRSIMSTSALEVDQLTDSVDRAAKDAIPGFATAIGNSEPVVAGLGTAIDEVSKGVGQFAADMSKNAPQAGTALAAVGAIVQNLLPIISTLSGEGVKLAAEVLPLVSSALGAVDKVVGVLAPELSMAAQAWAGWKIASTAAGWVDSFGGKVGGLTTKLTGSVTAGEKVSGTFSKIGSALPVLGVAVGLVGAAFEEGTQESNDWAQALLKGGAAAEQARSEMSTIKTAVQDNTTGTKGYVEALFGLSNAWNLQGAAVDHTSKSYKDLLAGMSPLQRAQALQTQAENDVSQAIKDHGRNSDVTAAKEQIYAQRTAEVQRQENLLQLAIRGVTDAMVAQDAQILAQTDAALGLRQGEQGVTQAQKDLNDAISQHGKNSAEAQQASLQFQQALQSQVELLGTYAQKSVPAALNADEAQALATVKMAQGLDDLHNKYGDLGPDLERERADLDASAKQYDVNRLQADALTAALGDTGLAVTRIPNSKAVEIAVTPTDPIVKALQGLGFTVTDLPDGNVSVEADTQQAQDNLNGVGDMLNGLTGTTATPTVDPNIGPAQQKTQQTYSLLDGLSAFTSAPTVDPNIAPAQQKTQTTWNLLGSLGGSTTSPTVSSNTNPFNINFGNVSATLNMLNRWTVWPTATLIANTSAAESAINYAARARYTTIYTTMAGGNTFHGMAATGGRIGNVVAGLVGGRYDVGGKVRGPGGPTDDLIQAITNGGAPLRVSNDEWVIKGSSSAKYGDAKMAAVNDGRAVITVPGPQPASRYATDGSGGGFSVGELHVHVNIPAGTAVITDRDIPQTVVAAMQQAILRLERASR